ncbi:hypothetical protein [Parenemella sanctibonifatiensis]|uniref:hypothetical protein n=1 Tax=Parenemella sanctibonifatiensis TaxID=2016505 RepID=UPI0011861E3C|nr:hypothetical protein [Parenemella sanctibonifatiensis]
MSVSNHHHDEGMSDAGTVATSPEAPKEKRKLPTWVPGVAVFLAILLIAGIAGSFLTRTGGPTETPTPTTTVVPVEGPLVLPGTVGEYALKPGGEPEATAGDDGVEIANGTYAKGGRDYFIALVLRPAANPGEVLRQINASGIREQSGGTCGRTADDRDACVVMRADVAVVAVGLRGQTIEELVGEAQQVADTL